MSRMLSCSAIALAVAASACGTVQSKPSTLSQESAPAPTTEATDPSVDAAMAAARSWLALVDQEKYSESWSAAATIFKSAVTEENWGSSVSGVRGPLGNVLSRQVESAKFTTSLPGAPDGKYVVIQFRSAFATKAAAVETVTPMQEADNSWKVSGYFIK